MDVISTVIKSMKDVGIEIEYDINADIDLRNYLRDSMLFISFIVELENNLGIELPYEILLNDNLVSFKGFCEMIGNLVSPKDNR